jgi:hypothetical protein
VKELDRLSVASRTFVLDWIIKNKTKLVKDSKKNK